MLKTIAEISPQLVAFILALRLSLSRPQAQHVTQITGALITAEGSKTLSDYTGTSSAITAPWQQLMRFGKPPGQPESD